MLPKNVWSYTDLLWSFAKKSINGNIIVCDIIIATAFDHFKVHIIQERDVNCKIKFHGAASGLKFTVIINL